MPGADCSVMSSGKPGTDAARETRDERNHRPITSRSDWGEQRETSHMLCKDEMNEYSRDSSNLKYSHYIPPNVEPLPQHLCVWTAC